MDSRAIWLGSFLLVACSATTNDEAGGAASTSSTDATAAATSAHATSVGSGTTGTGAGETLTSSFVYVGCNRLDKADFVPASNPSSANTAELTQTFADIAQLQDTPPLFFFTGDLVLGLDTKTSVLRDELDAWAVAYASDASGIATKLSMVPIAGNHEMLAKSKSTGKAELTSPAADGVWDDWLVQKQLAGFAGNGPSNVAPNVDALEDDQSKLTYSFDSGSLHYVVLNTDTATSTPDASTGFTKIGWIAMTWLEHDLAAAEANPNIEHIFVLGHKPIVSPTGDTAVDATVDTSFTSALESLLDQTTKVRGYFCAHAHLWDATRLPGPRGVYQVVAGNGGSPVESSWSAPFYGFTEVRIYSTGKVGVVSHERPVPSPYDGPASPTTPRNELVISP